MEGRKKFVIFAHSGTYDKLYQIVTLAITAASMGRETYIFLFFWALKRFVNEEFDAARLSAEFGEEGSRLSKRMQDINPISLKEILHELARQKDSKIIEGHLLIDHVHMCISIPPKHSVSSVVGFMKGKSAITIAKMSGKQRNFNGENFWARGYAVSTIGYDLEAIRKYIREQEDSDKQEGSF